MTLKRARSPLLISGRGAVIYFDDCFESQEIDYRFAVRKHIFNPPSVVNWPRGSGLMTLKGS